MIVNFDNRFHIISKSISIIHRIHTREISVLSFLNHTDKVFSKLLTLFFKVKRLNNVI